jgi:hypothetical protein
MMGLLAVISLIASIFLAYFLLRFLILGSQYYERELRRGEPDEKDSGKR